MTTPLKPFTIEEFIDNENTPVISSEFGKVWIAFPPNWKDYKYPVSVFLHTESSGFTCASHTADGARIKDHKPVLFFSPRKKVVPLDITDIKPGMAFRCIGNEHFFQTIKAAGRDYVTLALSGSITYETLRTDHEYSTDCVTWHRCEKEVEA